MASTKCRDCQRSAEDRGKEEQQSSRAEGGRREDANGESEAMNNVEPDLGGAGDGRLSEQTAPDAPKAVGATPRNGGPAPV